MELAESSQSKIKKAGDWRDKREKQAGAGEKKAQAVTAHETIQATLSCRAAPAQISPAAMVCWPVAR